MVQVVHGHVKLELSLRAEAIRDPTCSYCFERYSRIAGIDNIEPLGPERRDAAWRTMKDIRKRLLVTC